MAQTQLTSFSILACTLLCFFICLLQHLKILSPYVLMNLNLPSAFTQYVVPMLIILITSTLPDSLGCCHFSQNPQSQPLIDIHIIPQFPIASTPNKMRSTTVDNNIDHNLLVLNRA